MPRAVALSSVALARPQASPIGPGTGLGAGPALSASGSFAATHSGGLGATAERPHLLRPSLQPFCSEVRRTPPRLALAAPGQPRQGEVIARARPPANMQLSVPVSWRSPLFGGGCESAPAIGRRLRWVARNRFPPRGRMLPASGEGIRDSEVKRGPESVAGLGPNAAADPGSGRACCQAAPARTAGQALVEQLRGHCTGLSKACGVELGSLAAKIGGADMLVVSEDIVPQVDPNTGRIVNAQPLAPPTTRKIITGFVLLRHPTPRAAGGVAAGDRDGDREGDAAALGDGEAAAHTITVDAICTTPGRSQAKTLLQFLVHKLGEFGFQTLQLGEFPQSARIPLQFPTARCLTWLPSSPPPRRDDSLPGPVAPRPSGGAFEPRARLGGAIAVGGPSDSEEEDDPAPGAGRDGESVSELSTSSDSDSDNDSDASAASDMELTAPLRHEPSFRGGAALGGRTPAAISYRGGRTPAAISYRLLMRQLDSPASRPRMGGHLLEF
jgi:hypothetical protein